MKTLFFIPFLFMCSMVIGQFNQMIDNPYRLENLDIEVAEYDFPGDMTWDQAIKACYDLGNGWRLPSKDELNLMYIYRVYLPGLGSTTDYYLSGTEKGNGLVWGQFFDVNGLQQGQARGMGGRVRAVRLWRIR